MMRLSRYLAQAGICSRRQAEAEILAGKVTVNQIKVTELGTQVDEFHDIILFKGQPVSIEKKYYFLFFKPTGCLCTVTDPYGRPTVTDWFKQYNVRLYPVGRLDANTSGILLISNDGDFVNHMIHPRYKIDKTYQALVRGEVTKEDINRLLQGVKVDEDIFKADHVELIKKLKEESVLNITIHQGKKRQVRYMCDAIGHPTIALVRIQLAFLTLGDLKPGEFRELSSQEVQSLLKWGEKSDIRKHEVKAITPNMRDNYHQKPVTPFKTTANRKEENSEKKNNFYQKKAEKNSSTFDNSRYSRAKNGNQFAANSRLYENKKEEYPFREEKPYQKNGRHNQPEFNKKPEKREHTYASYKKSPDSDKKNLPTGKWIPRNKQ